MRRWLLPLVACAALAATPALAMPAMWRVSDADSSVYLFGSIHLFTKQMNWRSPEFDREVKDADHVYFEMLFDEAAYATFARALLVDGRLHDGRTLWDVLTPAEGDEVKGALSASKIDPATVANLQPWMAELMLSAGLISGAQVGVELTLDAEVDTARKRGLETAEEQIGFLAQGTEAEQVANLMSTVRQMGGADGDTMISDMMDAWERGDADALLKLNDDDLGDNAERYETLITKRNARWVTRIEQMLDENDDALVVVGAGHLVGPGGVPALLEQRGFTVERVGDVPAAATTPRRPVDPPAPRAVRPR